MTLRPQYYVPTLNELRAIGFALRSSPPVEPAARAGAPDQDILDLTTDPFSSLDDTYDRLTDLEDLLRDRGDRRSVFLTVYTRMTHAVIERIRADGFNDPAWATKYLVAFANRYRDALNRFERDQLPIVPEPWQLAFGASLGGETLVLQDALLGINAHINYDLTYTIRDVSVDPNRQAKLADHNTINEVLHQLIDIVQELMDEVYDAAGVSELDTLLGRVDEMLTFAGLTESRALAWRNAVLLTDARFGWVESYVHWRVRVVSTGGAYVILAWDTDHPAFRALRKVEEDETIATITDEIRRRSENQNL